MPEVERPKALQGRKANRAFIWQGCWRFSWDSADAKQAERSLKGNGVGDFQGMVVLLQWL